MENEQSIPVDLNITKLVVFVSSLLFTIGVYLIISTGAEWFYFSDYFNKLSILKYLSYGSLIYLLIIIVNSFVFPSNDSLNFSTMFTKRLQSNKSKIIFFIAKLETSLIVFLILFFVSKQTQINIIVVSLIIFGVLTILFQTSYTVVQRRVNIIEGKKLQLMSYVDQYLIENTFLSSLTAGFFQQLFPMIENVLIILLALMMPTVWWGTFVLIISQSFLYTFTFFQPFNLSKRGSYFRKYVNVLNSFILLYFTYLIFF